jgi:hypothetical protein
LTVASLIVRFIRSTWPLVQGWFGWVSHSNVIITYDDAAGTLSLSASGSSSGSSLTQEQVEDMVGSLVIQGTGISVAYDDTANTLTIALAGESYTPAEKSKLDGISAGATVNATDAALRDRTSHTGTQAISTITSLQTTLDAKLDGSLVTTFARTLLDDSDAATMRTTMGLTGTLQVGHTLAIDPAATYSGNPTPTISYRWQSRPNGGGTITSLVTASSLALAAAQEGLQIRVQDMARNSQGSTSWNSGSWLGPVAAAAAATKAGTLDNPPFSLSLGWNSAAAMSHNPWLDWMKTGMPWGNWDGPEPLIAAGHTNRAGDVLSVPAGGVSSYILYDLPADSGVSGHFRCTWTGTGTVQVLGAQNVTTIDASRIEFDYTATGSGFVEIRVSEVTSGPIRVAVVHQDDWTAADAGEVWRTSWLDMIRNSRVLRFKDWARIDNYAGGATWALRTPEAACSMMSDTGVSIESMIDLCNLVGADPWFCMPHTVDADYLTQFATLVLGRLDASRHVYVEWSNKVWDGNLGQSSWHSVQAGALLGDSALEGTAEFYGGKAAEMAQAWRAVWTGTNAARLHTVLQVWTDNHYYEGFALDAPRWVALQSGRVAPRTLMTEYAVHALLDGGLRYDWGSGAGNAVTGVQGWIDEGLTDSQIWDRMALACRNRADSFDEARTLEGEIDNWNYHKPIADAAGLNMIIHEGGTHIVTPASESGKPEWNALYNGFHTSQQWADLFDDMIDAWYGVAGASGMMNRMCDIMKPGANQNEGLLRFIGDSTPQWTVWTTQQAARQGATGRGASDFIGTYDLAS